MSEIGEPNRPDPTATRSDRPALETVVMVVALGAVVVGAFLPWVRGGRVDRDSFATVRLAERLGVADGWWQRVVLDVWFFLPFLAAMAVLALVLGRRRLAAVMVVIVGAFTAIIGLMVVASPADSRVGPWVAFLAGALASVGGCWVCWNERRRDE